MAVNTKAEIIIVAGLSSSGKSTFTEKYLLPDIRSRGLDPNKDVDIKYFEHPDDDISLNTKPVSVLYFNTHVDSDRYSVEEMRILREEKLNSLLLNRSEKLKLYLCYTPDHILMERIKARTENDSNGILSNINQRQLLLNFVEKFLPVVPDIQIVFSGKDKTGLMTIDDFRYGLPSEKLEAVINNPHLLDKATHTVLNLARNFVTRNTILRSFLIAVRNRWKRI
jgi:hypothetical protein